ncbi:MAG: hypothetical protein AAF696_07830 [Bacteroidota bacterium]
MKTVQILYRKAPDLPIYYRIDLRKGQIESLKDWTAKNKSMDTYSYSEEFADNIREVYQPISASTYASVKAGMQMISEVPRAKADCFEEPGPLVKRP